MVIEIRRLLRQERAIRGIPRFALAIYAEIHAVQPTAQRFHLAQAGKTDAHVSAGFFKIIVIPIIIQLRQIEHQRAASEIFLCDIRNALVAQTPIVVSPFAAFPAVMLIEPDMPDGEPDKLPVLRIVFVIAHHALLSEVAQKEVDVAALLVRNGKRRAVRRLAGQIARRHIAAHAVILNLRKAVLFRRQIRHAFLRRNLRKLVRLRIRHCAQNDVVLYARYRRAVSKPHRFRQRGHRRQRAQTNRQSRNPLFQIRFLPDKTFYPSTN